MTISLKVQKVIETDGEICITNIPFRKGERWEVIIRSATSPQEDKPPLTARKLLESGLVGMWKDRQDIGDSVIYARHLRVQSQNRSKRG